MKYEMAYCGLTGAMIAYCLTGNGPLVFIALFIGAITGAIIEARGPAYK